ncbi:MAG: acylneuraminate cytidylyltransferase family protein [Planctomycetes bacterium]|nr:acylneuraminate cytidylyltransferase family protein [Planctomycetota bacterium]
MSFDYPVGVIPARGGSKGLWRKNLRKVGKSHYPPDGKPLLWYSIKLAQAAVDAGILKRAIVSSEDAEIIEYAKAEGADVPFVRPAELARDDTPDFPVMKHAIDFLAANGPEPDVCVMIRPTSPLRTLEDVRDVLATLTEDATGVRSCVDAPSHPYWCKKLEDGFLVPFVDGKSEKSYPNRQTLESAPAFALCGFLDAFRTENLKFDEIFGGRIALYKVGRDRAVDINVEVDLDYAELLLARLPHPPFAM